MARHTPGPWVAQKPDPSEGVGIIGVVLNELGEPHFTPTNGLVAVATMFPTELDNADTARAEANAALIVRAVNAHDALLSIVERFIALPSGAWHPERHAAEEAELMQEAKAAIAKAKGGAAVSVERCQCGAEATTSYDGDRYCEPCATYSARRDFEESEMPGGFA